MIFFLLLNYVIVLAVKWFHFNYPNLINTEYRITILVVWNGGFILLEFFI